VCVFTHRLGAQRRLHPPRTPWPVTATRCNTLQHTVPHCNTLQHTAIHCNTLQHIATHCNALQYTYIRNSIFAQVGCTENTTNSTNTSPYIHARRHQTISLSHTLCYIRYVCCSVLQCVAVCCSVLQHVAVCCSVLQCVAVCCSVLQCVAVCQMRHVFHLNVQHISFVCMTCLIHTRNMSRSCV